ncbi:MAG: septation protein SepH [Actinomycetaceae bacterium]|nr:septation protein SepH [Actinomycetaceae bacterium]
MLELELLGPSPEGNAVILTDVEGKRYTLPISDELRIAVRRPIISRTEPRLPPPQAHIRPREIQALLRSGRSAEEIAKEHEVDVQMVQRLEGPIVAERNYFAARALSYHIGSDETAPTIEELVINRLAARGIDTSLISWDATREAGKTWLLHLTYVKSGAEVLATWQVDTTTKSVTALDSESMWLTETAVPAGPSRGSRMLRPLPNVMEPEEEPETIPEITSGTEHILEELNKQRGKRQEPSSDLEDMFEDEAEDPPSMEPPRPILEIAELPKAGASANKRRNGRREMPSWDEIVFGAKP